MSPVTILLVDDNHCDQRLAVEAIKESNRGTRLQIVGDGEEALSYLLRKGKYRDVPRPQLIILDLNLPRKDGREVLAEVRGEPTLKAIPVVIWTGAKAPLEMDAIRRLNPNFSFTKPDDVEDFLAAVQAVEEYARNLTAFPQRGKECLERLRQLVAGSHDLGTPVSHEQSPGGSPEPARRPEPR